MRSPPDRADRTRRGRPCLRSRGTRRRGAPGRCRSRTHGSHIADPHRRGRARRPRALGSVRDRGVRRPPRPHPAAVPRAVGRLRALRQPRECRRRGDAGGARRVRRNRPEGLRARAGQAHGLAGAPRVPLGRRPRPARPDQCHRRPRAPAEERAGAAGGGLHAGRGREDPRPVRPESGPRLAPVRRERPATRRRPPDPASELQPAATLPQPPIRKSRHDTTYAKLAAGIEPATCRLQGGCSTN